MFLWGAGTRMWSWPRSGKYHSYCSIIPCGLSKACWVFFLWLTVEFWRDVCRPRMTMRLFEIRGGTLENKDGDVEWHLNQYTRTSRKKNYL